jgi:hypothetical protein
MTLNAGRAAAVATELRSADPLLGERVVPTVIPYALSEEIEVSESHHDLMRERRVALE